MDTPTTPQKTAEPWIRAWLYFVAVLVFAMVIVGGATRLTDSGLSITEWLPILGAIPPLTEADWAVAFEKYKQIPEYKIINRGMSLDEFKFIYWWEWGHRFLGRFIGLAFAVPLAFFWLTGGIARDRLPGLLGLLVLGGLQGALGWYMVMSGLVERTDVSQYRLAAHLTLATVIFAAIIWVALGYGRDRLRLPPSTIHVIIALVLLQIAAGGFVAGIDAGMAYNTWPLMDGAIIPDGLLAMQPAWINLFENALTVQFQHRALAYLIALVVLAYTLTCLPGLDGNERSSVILMLFVTAAQIALGIWTLLAQVPVSLGLLHQGGALVLLAAALYHLHCLSLRRA
jgi:cytochrome c oxidase assembly protein subunit 15